MKTLAQAIAEFRQTLSDHQSRFLLVYTEKNMIAETLDCHVTSNSDQAGVRAIMSFLMRPSPETIALAAKALEDVARASAGLLPGAIEEATAAGVFTDAAKVLFEKMRGTYTITGWENREPKKSEVS